MSTQREDDTIRAEALRDAARAIAEDAWPPNMYDGAMQVMEDLYDRAAMIQHGDETLRRSEQSNLAKAWREGFGAAFPATAGRRVVNPYEPTDPDNWV